ncbi:MULTISPECIES: hypothetical protein [Pseudomonas]|uniref:Uncharacterized protein n=1 Tax=Pseudomonas oryzihabitans TaxID=47885 RepID=A0A0U4P621_9PSED|nr:MULTISPECIES: hypothetical protein [Pseudomonas]ALZ85806.1 hypothetical protein APT59_16965 [Pseudomonas oryzihabitans]WCE10714.1 hypothetical protein PJ259_10885 [Pseudomonas sp. JBR1]
MKRVAGCLLGFLFGMAEVQAQVPPATSGAAPGILMITRGDTYSASGCDVGVRVQGRLMGTLMPGQSASYNLPPGEVVVSLTSAGQGYCAAPMATTPSQSILLAPGEIKQYRIVATEGGYYLAPMPLY